MNHRLSYELPVLLDRLSPCPADCEHVAGYPIIPTNRLSRANQANQASCQVDRPTNHQIAKALNSLLINWLTSSIQFVLNELNERLNNDHVSRISNFTQNQGNLTRSKKRLFELKTRLCSHNTLICNATSHNTFNVTLDARRGEGGCGGSGQ